jgi:transcriptional regulator with XRE-family HTH domain
MIPADSRLTVFRLCPEKLRGGHFLLDYASLWDYILLVSIGAAIRAAREAKGLGQLELAQAVGAARETVCRWELGRLNVGPRSIMALETVLGPLGVTGVKRTGAARKDAPGRNTQGLSPREYGTTAGIKPGRRFSLLSGKVRSKLRETKPSKP